MSRKNSNRSAMIGAALLALLALLAGGLWFASTQINKPLQAEGAADTQGYKQLFSVYGNGPDRLYRPIEVATDAQGNVYAADSFKHRIAVFDSKGKFVRAIGGPGKIQGELKYPHSVKVDERGRVYVASGNSRIVIYGPDGKLLKWFPVPNPTTLAVTRDRLYVANAQGILIGDLDGKQVGQVPGVSAGKGPGQIDRATALAFGDDGTIYIADSMNYRVQAIDKNGKPLWQTGTPPDPKTATSDRKRTFGLPAGLMMGSDGLLYLIDAFNGQIVVMNKDGEVLSTYGDWGRQDGQFYYPSSIAEVSPETFVVADTFNDRLQFVHIPTRNPNLAIQGQRAWPWLLPLAALGLILLLLRRPVAVVVDAAALRRASVRGALDELIEQAKALYAPAGTAETVSDLIEANPGLLDVLREVELDGEADDPMIEIALGMRGRLGLRKAAVAFPTEAQAALAREHGIGVLDEGAPGETSPAAA